MKCWTKFSAKLYLQHFVLIKAILFTLALSFDLALELDQWMLATNQERWSRFLGMLLVIIPISLWLSALSCILKWQWSQESLLLRAYGMSTKQVFGGVYFVIAMLIFIWFGIKEVLWIQIAPTNTKEKLLLINLNEGKLLLEKKDGHSETSVWLKTPSEEGRFQDLNYIDGKGWTLKEFRHKRNAEMKLRFEALINQAIPNAQYLEMKFGSLDLLSLSELFDLKHLRASLHLYIVRFGLPVLCWILLCLCMPILLQMHGLKLWKTWGSLFLCFVLIVAFAQHQFT